MQREHIFDILKDQTALPVPIRLSRQHCASHCCIRLQDTHIVWYEFCTRFENHIDDNAQGLHPWYCWEHHNPRSGIRLHVGSVHRRGPQQRLSWWKEETNSSIFGLWSKLPSTKNCINELIATITSAFLKQSKPGKLRLLVWFDREGTTNYGRCYRKVSSVLSRRQHGAW